MFSLPFPTTLTSIVLIWKQCNVLSCLIYNPLANECTVSFKVVCNQTLHDKRRHKTHKSRVYAMYTHFAVWFNCQLYIRVREPSIVCCWSIPYNKVKYFLARLVFHCEKRTNMRQTRHEYTLFHSIIHGYIHTLRCVVYVSSSSRDFWNSCFLKDAMSF